MLEPNTVLQDRYVIVRQIGQGGMGAVYQATDKRLHSTVALKQTMFSDSSMQRAFEREAKLLAHLRHPALPKVIDYFFEGNGQYLVMEFVPGDDMAARMDKTGGKFPLHEVFPWVMRWADQLLGALEYLHTQNPPVIHRDIKPQNLKLTSRGDVVLLDFGLARGGLADISTVTARGNVEGYTPNYAPLEQIRGSDPDARSDLYSLAATMYHFLIGAKPPDALTRAASLLNNQSDPLRLISDLNPTVPVSVATILHRTMSLNPDNRPATASAMRKALQQRMTQNLGTAESPVVTENLHVSAQNIQISGPITGGGGGGSGGSDGGGSGGSGGSGGGGGGGGSGGGSGGDGDGGTAQTQRLSTDEPPGTLIRTIITGSPVLSVAFSPDGQTAAAAGEDCTITLWDLVTGSQIHSLEGHDGSVRSIAFSPDGTILASGSEDKTLRIWWVKDGAETHQVEIDAIESVVFSPDGSTVAVGSWSGAVSLFRIGETDLEEVESFSASIVHCLAFSPDGQTMVAGCYDTNILMWSVSDGTLLKTLEGHTNFVLAIAISPDGYSLASAGGGTGIRLWRMSDGRQLDVLHGHDNFVHGLAYSPDGKLLASASADNSVKLWRTNDGAVIHSLEQHGDGVTSVAFSPDGYTLISGCRDQKLRLWQVQSAE